EYPQGFEGRHGHDFFQHRLFRTAEAEDRGRNRFKVQHLDDAFADSGDGDDRRATCDEVVGGWLNVFPSNAVDLFHGIGQAAAAEVIHLHDEDESIMLACVPRLDIEKGGEVYEGEYVIAQSKAPFDGGW